MPMLLADCPSCGSPIYDIECQTNCPQCGKEIPEWFKDIHPERTPLFEDCISRLFQWCEENVFKIEHRTYTFDGKPDIRWNVTLKSGEVWQGRKLQETLTTARKGDGQ